MIEMEDAEVAEDPDQGLEEPMGGTMTETGGSMDSSSDEKVAVPEEGCQSTPSQSPAFFFLCLLGLVIRRRVYS